MKNLQHIIRRLCRRAEMRYTLAADGTASPSVMAGVVCTYRTTTICCSPN